MISTDLLLKGLGGLAVVGTASGVGIWYFNRGKTEELSTFAARVGLVCNAATGQTEETGIECTIEEKGLSVKQETNKEEGKKKSGTPAGKIKGYKVGDGFKFVIEDGDITLTAGTPTPGTNISKLEQFETYEIKEDEKDKKQYLTRKNDAKKEIKLALGLPETGCDLPTTAEAKTCALDADKIKKINFDGRKGEPKVVNGAAEEAATALNSTLKISKPSTDENSIFPHGYKFELQSNKEITLDSGANKSIKKDTNTEFKIKVTPAAGGPKLTLEKAWTVTEFAKKVGLVCNEALTNGVGECTLKDGSVNVNNNVSGASETNKKFENHSKKDNNENNKKVKFELNQEGYNQGFKFYAEQEICLKNSTNSNGNDRKIEAKGNNNEVSYQILKDTDTKWYLTKKTTPAPAA